MDRGADSAGSGLSAEMLERWVSFGARWRAVLITDQRAVVDLCECTGELVERRETEDPEVIKYLRRTLPLGGGGG